MIGGDVQAGCLGQRFSNRLGQAERSADFHGGAAVETKRSGLKIPDDELSSEIKNSAKIMIIYNTVLRYLGVTPALLRGKLDNDATSTDTAGRFVPVHKSVEHAACGRKRGIYRLTARRARR